MVKRGHFARSRKPPRFVRKHLQLLPFEFRVVEETRSTCSSIRVFKRDASVALRGATRCIHVLLSLSEVRAIDDDDDAKRQTIFSKARKFYLALSIWASVDVDLPRPLIWVSSLLLLSANSTQHSEVLLQLIFRDVRNCQYTTINCQKCRVH